MSESYPPSNPFERKATIPKAEKKPNFIVPVEEIIPGIKPKRDIRQEIENIDLGAPFPDQFVGLLADRIEPWIFNEKSVKEEIKKRRKTWDYVLRDAEKRNIPTMKKRALERISELRSDIENKSPLTSIFRYFRNQIVVDLGAGESYYLHNLASILGAKAYVGVEKYHANTLKENIGRSTPETIERDFDRGPANVEPIPAAIESEDMLSFLRRLPDNSVSIFASGIDRNIICDNEYLQAVRDEIARVLHPEGAYICNESHALEFVFEDITCEQPKERENIFLYTKKV